MKDYEPVDVTRFCNADARLLGFQEEAPIGSQTFRGLPFQVGPATPGDGDPCFISLTGADGALTVPVGMKARNVVMAHGLLETDIPNGGPAGIAVAEYVFRLSGGREERVSVRERFEIGAVLQAHLWGVTNALDAVLEQYWPKLDRHLGPWEQAGRKQTDLVSPGAPVYYLWCWANPDPEALIESLEIVPCGPPFFVAGVTLGHVDEFPFAREAARPVRIVLTDEADAERPFGLDVEVDRGVATWVQPLPQAPVGEFMNDSMKGWGESQNTKSSPAYAEISATPSATITVRSGSEDLGKVKWADVDSQGSASAQRVRLELVEPGKNWVHVKVLDEETGRPVPCRVSFRSPEGVPYQPHGFHNHVNSGLDTWHIDVGGDVRLGQITYAYIDGTCQGWLPRGDVIVDVARGFEYQPLRTRVRVEPGQQELTLSIRRWTDMNRRGWYGGDSHVHFLSTQGAHREAQAEGLNVINLLASQWGSLFTNTEDWTGRPDVSPDGNSIVYVSQENRQHLLGHMILLGLKKPVMPWCSAGPNEAELGGPMETTLGHWADEAHEQGGFVVMPHFPAPNAELPALIATGRVDAVEMALQDPFMHREYYRYLNAGYRIPLVGGTDKMSSDVPVGLYRTYAKIPDDQEFNYETWCQSVVDGRTFMTSGPIIELKVDGRDIGDTVRMSGPGVVEVEARAESIFPMHNLDVIANGQVVASTNSDEGERKLTLKERIKIDGHSWIAARTGRPDSIKVRHLVPRGRGIFAHTSPVFIACGGEWWMFNKDTAQYMLTLIDGSLRFISRHSGQHLPGTVTHHHGEADHMAYLERPFQQAIQAIRDRLRVGK